MESARMHHHKRRSSSEQDAPSPSSSTCSSSTESAASEHQDITLPFRFESRPVSPLSEGESARASVRRKLSEEGNFQGQRTQPGGPNDPTQAQAQAQTQSQSQSVQLQSIQSLPRPGTRSATNSLGLSRLNSSSSTTPTKSSMAMRRRASLPKLNLAVANRASPALTLRPSTCTSTAASKLLDAFSATTHPDAQEQFPYANGPIQVSPGLYLGAEHNTTDGELLRRFNIGAVLNVAKEVSDPFADSPCLKPPPPAVPTSSSSSLLTEPQRIRVAASTPDLRAKFSDALTLLAHSHTIDYPETSSFPALSYLHVPFSHDVSNLAAALPGLIAFINHHLERGVSVLVHCQCGVSRSASVVVAWVMQAQQLAMHAAYDKVKEQSPYISPNISLLYQLVDFERSQKSPTSTHASSSLTSEEGDEDSLRTPPDETAFHHHHDEAIVNGLLSPALADRLAFSPPEQEPPLPPTPHTKPGVSISNSFPILVHSPSPSGEHPPSRITSPVSPLTDNPSDPRVFRSYSLPGVHPASRFPSSSLSSPVKSHFNFDFNGLATVPEAGHIFGARCTEPSSP